MDAEAGNIYINPSPEIIAQFSARNRARNELFHESIKLNQETLTKEASGYS